MAIVTRALKSGYMLLLTILAGAVLSSALPLMAAVDEEVEVISYTGAGDDIYLPQVAASAGCGFVVAYSAHVFGENSEYDYLNWGRLFTSYGAPLDGPFQINVAQGYMTNGLNSVFSVSVPLEILSAISFTLRRIPGIVVSSELPIVVLLLWPSGPGCRNIFSATFSMPTAKS